MIALWSSSAALVAIIAALNKAYDIDEGRPWWKQRITALLLTVGLAIFILLSFALVVVGPEAGRFFGSYFGLGHGFVVAWYILQWPVVFLLVATGFGLVYYFGPNVDQDLVWFTPGSVLV